LTDQKVSIGPNLAYSQSIDRGSPVDLCHCDVTHSCVNLHDALRLLFSRRTHYQFGYASLLTVLPVYFIFTCWASGSAVASGIVVPMM
jgi:Voltage gated chloride channel